jgi:hypothetical protein
MNTASFTDLVMWQKAHSFVLEDASKLLNSYCNSIINNQSKK